MFFWEHDVYQAVENWSTTPLYDAMRYREFNVDQKMTVWSTSSGTHLWPQKNKNVKRN